MERLRSHREKFSLASMSSKINVVGKSQNNYNNRDLHWYSRKWCWVGVEVLVMVRVRTEIKMLDINQKEITWIQGKRRFVSIGV